MKKLLLAVLTLSILSGTSNLTASSSTSPTMISSTGGDYGTGGG